MKLHEWSERIAAAARSGERLDKEEVRALDAFLLEMIDAQYPLPSASLTRDEVWARAAAACMPIAVASPLDEATRIAMITAKSNATKTKILEAHRRAVVAGIAEWADFLADEWTKRNGGEHGRGA